ncbi:hypothetical protein [Pelagibaculum spongiae]|uniref:Uncharacterized protein n=1 Tax=Pelagibaculum spongiae TaxID=2080658 RepID=A0A2V1GSS8_9GAMM|nr:hypothetical protein [Pelagibaculum spongiae]PVZ67773.1 hypothetical protein DC094_15180 [Pelagibaculum spongiae]
MRDLNNSDVYCGLRVHALEEGGRVMTAGNYWMNLSKGQIMIWRASMPCQVSWQLDCCGFALNTWKRFCYSVYLDYVQIVLDEEFFVIENKEEVRAMDLMVFYQIKSIFEPCHLARVTQPSISENSIEIIDKFGTGPVKKCLVSDVIK